MYSISETEYVAVRISFGDGFVDVPFGNILRDVSLACHNESLLSYTLMLIGMESSPTNSRSRFKYSSLLGRIRKSSNPGSGRMMNMNSCPEHSVSVTVLHSTSELTYKASPSSKHKPIPKEDAPNPV